MTNHELWLETVPEGLLPYVDRTVAAWNAEADGGNQWDDLGWDERDDLLREMAAKD